MVTYNFLAKCPTTINLAGTIYRLTAGQTLPLSETLGQLVEEGQIPGAEDLMLVSKEEETEGTEAVEEPAYELNFQAPEVEDETEEIVYALLEDSVLPEVPLEDSAHWSTVKAFLVSMEDEDNVDKLMVEAVRRKFPNFQAVQAEAERLLES